MRNWYTMVEERDKDLMGINLEQVQWSHNEI